MAYFPSSTESPSTLILNKRRGRQVGAKNKATESIRWGFVEAYRQLGGVDGLVKWGKKKPDLFYPMLTKLLPHELAESGLGGNLTVIIQRKSVETPSSVPPQVVGNERTIEVVDQRDASTRNDESQHD